MPDKLTKEETELALSAQEAHCLIETCGSTGWKEVIKKKYLDVRLEEAYEYLHDIKNNDLILIQAMRLQIDFIETLMSEIETQVKIGLEDEADLVKRKEKKKK